MFTFNSGRRLLAASLVILALGAAAPALRADGAVSVNLHVFTPKSGDVSGVNSAATMVDLSADFNCSGCSGASPELTGPGSHANVLPFPGTFGPGADTDHFPGLVVLLSTTPTRPLARLAGPGTNVANDFNLVTITNRKPDFEQVWATWIIGAKNVFGIAGQDTPARLLVAVVGGTAPDVVTDMNGDGVFDEKDLEAMGFSVISNVVVRDFIISGF